MNALDTSNNEAIPRKAKTSKGIGRGRPKGSKDKIPRGRKPGTAYDRALLQKAIAETGDPNFTFPVTEYRIPEAVEPEEADLLPKKSTRKRRANRLFLPEGFVSGEESCYEEEMMNYNGVTYSCRSDSFTSSKKKKIIRHHHQGEKQQLDAEPYFSDEDGLEELHEGHHQFETPALSAGPAFLPSAGPMPPGFGVPFPGQHQQQYMMMMMNMMGAAGRLPFPQGSASGLPLPHGTAPGFPLPQTIPGAGLGIGGPIAPVAIRSSLLPPSLPQSSVLDGMNLPVSGGFVPRPTSVAPPSFATGSNDANIVNTNCGALPNLRSHLPPLGFPFVHGAGLNPIVCGGGVTGAVKTEKVASPIPGSPDSDAATVNLDQRQVEAKLKALLGSA